MRMRTMSIAGGIAAVLSLTAALPTPAARPSYLSITNLQITPATASYGDPIELTATLGNTASQPVTVQLGHVFGPVSTYNNGEFWCGQPLGLPPGAAQCAHQLEPACGGEITIPGRGTLEYSVTLNAGVLCSLPGVMPDPEPDQYIRLSITELSRQGRVIDRASEQLHFELVP